MTQRIFDNSEELANHLQDHAAGNLIVTPVRPSGAPRPVTEVNNYFQTALAATNGYAAGLGDDLKSDYHLAAQASHDFNRIVNAITQAAQNRRFR